jgi:large subunit ribosomal protein L15
VVNVGDLEAAAGRDRTVSPDTLVARGLVHRGRPVKVLGNGELKGALKVVADKFSGSARAKIEAAGGTCELRQPRTSGGEERAS